MYPDNKGLELLEETKAWKVASMALAGKNQHQIGQELGLSWRQVKKHLNSEECKELMRKIKDAYLVEAQNRFKVEGSKLVGEAIEVIRKHLKDGNLQAVPHVMKLVELDKEVPAQAQQTIMQIVMPDTGKAE